MSDELTTPGGKLRLFVEAALGQGARVEPDEGLSHYLLHVMRGKIGDRISLFNGRDGEWLAHIAEISKRTCILECERLTAPQREVPDVWLVFAPIKKTPADYLTQKATELGVRVLQPVMTRRTVVTRVNLERMRANAVEAAEQSGRLGVPEVRETVTFEKLLDSWPGDRWLLFCDEGAAAAQHSGEASPIAECLHSAPDGPWAVITGPEGGFDPAERARLRELPFVVPVLLGGRILRADTAALAALAVWQSIRGDWRRG